MPLLPAEAASALWGSHSFFAEGATPHPGEDLSLLVLIRTKTKSFDHLDKMTGERLAGLFLLLWMTATVSGQEDLLNNFVNDIISTFNLTLPTVLYDSDEPPQTCYENTPERRVLCLQVTEEEQRISIDRNDTGMYVQGSNFLTEFI